MRRGETDACPHSTSPESIDLKMFSPASDVWAFGVVCWEIVTYGAMPYEQVRNADISPKIRGGLRLPLVGNEDFYNVMLLCWNPSWKERPTFNVLRNKILM